MIFDPSDSDEVKALSRIRGAESTARHIETMKPFVSRFSTSLFTHWMGGQFRKTSSCAMAA
jgi:hypothetical protein